MKKFLSILVALVAIVTLAACGKKETTGVAYGKVHGQYVGIVTLQVKEGKVTGGTIDELYLPYNFANLVGQVTAEGTDVVAQVAVNANTGVATTTYWAKYVKIGSNNVTATVVTGKVTRPDGNTAEGWGDANEKATATVVYNVGSVDMKVWIATQANADAYAAAAKDDQIYVATSAFAKHATLKTRYAHEMSLTGIDQFLKSKTNYGGANWDWKGAMTGLVTIFTGTAMDADLTKAVRNADTGIWSLDGVATSATLVDFKDYYSVGVTAFNNAK